MNEINPVVAHAGAPVDAPVGWFIELTNPGPDSVTVIAFAECTKLVDVP